MQVIVSDLMFKARTLDSIILSRDEGAVNVELRMSETASHRMNEEVTYAKRSNGGLVAGGLQRYGSFALQ